MVNNINDLEYKKFTEEDEGIFVKTKNYNYVSDVFFRVEDYELTSTYADVGEEIDVSGCDKIGIYISGVANDSENCKLKIITRLEEDGDDYVIDGFTEKTLWTTATDTNGYYEIDTGAMVLLQLQLKADAIEVGEDVGLVTIDVVKK